METTTTRTCLVGQQLCQVQASIESKETFTSFIKALKEVISGLIENPFDEKYNIIRKDNEALSQELLETQEIRDLLTVLGYAEELSGFVYKVSDENMSKLQSCVEIIESYIFEEKTTSLGDISDIKSEDSIELSESEQSLSREEKAVSLKELFLAKHMKKENSDDMMGARKRDTATIRSSDFSFNTNGFFQQSSSNRDTRRNKCFRRELFHQQDHTTKGLGSSGFHVKRI